MLFKIVIKLKIPFQNDKTITEEKKMTSIMNEKGTSPGPHRPREENKGYYENKPYTKEFENLAEKNKSVFKSTA